MNHISFDLALLRQDELVREAAERRLAYRLVTVRRATPRLTSLFRAHQLQLLARVRPAVRG
jgi:hypothetical protein